MAHQQVPVVDVPLLLWQHSSRRAPRVPSADKNGRTMRRLFSDPQYYLWSTDIRSKQLVPQYLVFLEAGKH